MLKIHFVCITYLLIVTVVVRCKPDYKFNNEVGGWLKVHTIPATWSEAFLRCYYEGAVLASPLNKELANALHSVSNENRQIFLGTHDLFSSKGDFASVEGVPLSDMEITWGLRGTGPDTGNCLTMTMDGRAYYMNTSSCKEPLPFICYKKLDNKTINECGSFDEEYHLNQRTGSCYKLHLEKRTWDRAYMICASEGGHLVILDDEEEARIVQDMFPVRSGDVNMWEQFHIGLLAWGDDRTWITIHGDRVENVYNHWKPGQPDNNQGTQRYGTLLREGAMDDGWPTTKAMFVCEKSPDSIRFEALPLDIEERLQ